MGLLNTYGDNNLSINTGKTVSYWRSPVGGTWSWTEGTVVTTKYQAWECHRACSMSYSYVGMDKTTAEACARDLVELLTRTTKVSQWTDQSASSTHEFQEEDGGLVLMSDVSVVHTGGKMYSVNVTVHEDDVRLRLTPPSDISGLFTAENARAYTL